MKPGKFVLLGFCAASLGAQAPVEVAPVVSRSVQRQVRLPGEFLPYLQVAVHAKVTGFVEKVAVDRGSMVKAGDLLVTLSAPEIAAHLAEAESKVQAAESQRAEAQARRVAAESTWQRLKAASATPGAIAGNELVQAEKAVEAAEAMVRAAGGAAKAAQAAAAAVRELQKYLRVTAPFDGVVTERLVHPGALVGPNASPPTPMLRIEQLSRLRLVVAVPESDVAGIVRSARVPFHVPAFPGETFSGTVARVAHSIDPRTRTMAVELDVANGGGRLAPGMYPEVVWPVRRPRASLLVPPTSVVTTTERTFVIRVTGGAAEWVPVTRGAPAGDLVEVYGALRPGDLVVRRGSDEIREGTRLAVKPS